MIKIFIGQIDEGQTALRRQKINMLVETLARCEKTFYSANEIKKKLIAS